MNKSECLVCSLMLELDSLISRIKNIDQAYSRTTNEKLQDRLFFENRTIFKRIEEILSFAEFLVERSKEKLTLSSLLLEKCRRSIYEINVKRNLFFL